MYREHCTIRNEDYFLYNNRGKPSIYLTPCLLNSFDTSLRPFYSLRPKLVVQTMVIVQKID